eukprot:643447-Amphidinium_carterae.1
MTTRAPENKAPASRATNNPELQDSTKQLSFDTLSRQSDSTKQLWFDTLSRQSYYMSARVNDGVKQAMN